MKLDKIKFAYLIGWIERVHAIRMSENDIRDLDDLIEIEMPEPQTVYSKNENVERLMALMAAGTHKIDAILEHRAITGMGLKESKDAVERYWPKKTGPGYVKAELVTKLIESNYTVEEKAAIEHFLNKL